MSNTFIRKKFNLQLDANAKATSVLINPDSALALVRYRKAGGAYSNARFDMGKGIYIDPPVTEFNAQARKAVETKTADKLAVLRQALPSNLSVR